MKPHIEKEFVVIPGYSNYLINKNGQVFSIKRNRFLIANNKGYKAYGLINDDGKRVLEYAHRLIVKTFYGDIPKGLEVSHLDDSKDNCALGNLCLMTHKQNCMYGSRNKKIKDALTGKKKYRFIFSVEDGEQERVIHGVASLMRAYPSQSSNTWFQRLRNKDNLKTEYQFVENGRLITVRIKSYGLCVEGGAA